MEDGNPYEDDGTKQEIKTEPAESPPEIDIKAEPEEPPPELDTTLNETDTALDLTSASTVNQTVEDTNTTTNSLDESDIIPLEPTEIKQEIKCEPDSDGEQNKTYICAADGTITVAEAHEKRFRQRRKRTPYSRQQLLELETEFEQHQFIGHTLRAQISARLQLDDRQVKVWFQNRRAKVKRVEAGLASPWSTARWTDKGGTREVIISTEGAKPLDDAAKPNEGNQDIKDENGEKKESENGDGQTENGESKDGEKDEATKAPQDKPVQQPQERPIVQMEQIKTEKGIKFRQKRTNFSPEQLKILETEFAEKKYLNFLERSELAAELRLTETQVQVWFQNRRGRYKKINPETIDLDAATGNQAGPVQVKTEPQWLKTEPMEGSDLEPIENPSPINLKIEHPRVEDQQPQPSSPPAMEKSELEMISDAIRALSGADDDLTRNDTEMNYNQPSAPAPVAVKSEPVEPMDVDSTEAPYLALIGALIPGPLPLISAENQPKQSQNDTAPVESAIDLTVPVKNEPLSSDSETADITDKESQPEKLEDAKETSDLESAVDIKEETLVSSISSESVATPQPANSDPQDPEEKSAPETPEVEPTLVKEEPLSTSSSCASIAEPSLAVGNAEDSKEKSDQEGSDLESITIKEEPISNSPSTESISESPPTTDANDPEMKLIPETTSSQDPPMDIDVQDESQSKLIDVDDNDESMVKTDTNKVQEKSAPETSELESISIKEEPNLDSPSSESISKSPPVTTGNNSEMKLAPKSISDQLKLIRKVKTDSGPKPMDVDGKDESKLKTDSNKVEEKTTPETPELKSTATKEPISNDASVEPISEQELAPKRVEDPKKNSVSVSATSLDPPVDVDVKEEPYKATESIAETNKVETPENKPISHLTTNKDSEQQQQSAPEESTDCKVQMNGDVKSEEPERITGKGDDKDVVVVNGDEVKLEPIEESSPPVSTGTEKENKPAVVN